MSSVAIIIDVELIATGEQRSTVKVKQDLVREETGISGITKEFAGHVLKQDIAMELGVP
jgi:hypothetical protein